MLNLLSYGFVPNACCAVVLISCLCGFLSPVVVLKQRAYLSDAISHLVFPGVVTGIILSQYASISMWYCVLIGATITALFGSFLSEWILKILKIPSDASAVICLTAFFALGVVLVSNQKGTRISPEDILFGDALTLNKIYLYILSVVFIFIVSCLDNSSFSI